MIAHAIYRFIDDTTNVENVDLLKDIAVLYHTVNLLSWQPLAGVFKCEEADKLFCATPISLAMQNLKASVKNMHIAYEDAMIRMQSNKDVLDVFTLQKCFDSKNGIPRCLEKDSDYLPPGFFAKVTNGYSAIINNILTTAERYIHDIVAHDDLTEEAAMDFWFLYEVMLSEAEGGSNAAFKAGKDALERSLIAGTLAASVSYAVGLGASFIIFFWVFGSVRKSIQSETRFNRGVLYMVPHDVLRNTKAIIEYIETLSAAI